MLREPLDSLPPAPDRAPCPAVASEPPGSPPVYPAKPGPIRGLAVVAGLASLLLWLGTRGDTGEDDMIGRMGRIEVTARLDECPDPFPSLGAYRYTYVLKYRVLEIHRPDPAGQHPLRAGDDIFVGHYKPWQPRSAIQDADWGDRPLGGRLSRFVPGDTHRLALDYELADLAPSGVLDFCYPPGSNRFFAVWANPVGD